MVPKSYCWSAMLAVLLMFIIPTVAAMAGADGSGAPAAGIQAPKDNALFLVNDTIGFRAETANLSAGASFGWDFGDGNSSNASAPFHSYSQPGNYTVTLNVTDGAVSGNAVIRLLVREAAGGFLEIVTVTPGTLRAKETLAFRVQGPIGGPLPPDMTYIWDFGDGTTYTGERPSHIYQRPGDYTITLRSINDTTVVTRELLVTVAPGRVPVAGGFPWLYAYAAVTVILVVGVVGFFAGTEVGLSLLFPIIIFMYSRIRQEHILDNYTRGQIHGYIMANPGEHYAAIKTALKLNNGTLAYHLRRLESEKVIKSMIDGVHRRYFPSDFKLPDNDAGSLTEVQKIVISKIRQTPGISQNDIAVLMGLSRATVNYHIERLLDKKMVRRERAGMRYRCYLCGDALRMKGPEQKES